MKPLLVGLVAALLAADMAFYFEANAACRQGRDAARYVVVPGGGFVAYWECGR